MDPEPITRNVGDLLDDLFRECEHVVGKPAALMTKDERIRAIGYPDVRRSSSQIQREGLRVLRRFKYSFYSYLNEAKALAESAE